VYLVEQGHSKWEWGVEGVSITRQVWDMGGLEWEDVDKQLEFVLCGGELMCSIGVSWQGDMEGRDAQDAALLVAGVCQQCHMGIMECNSV